MATTQTVTGHVVNSVRTNDDGTRILVVTVTFADASTDQLDLPVIRVIP